MANKPFIRSVRFSQETYDAINNQIGENFSEKLENMIVRCMFELPEKEKELKRINVEIGKQSSELVKIKSIVRDLKSRLINADVKLSSFHSAICDLQSSISNVKEYQ